MTLNQYEAHFSVMHAYNKNNDRGIEAYIKLDRVQDEYLCVFPSQLFMHRKMCVCLYLCSQHYSGDNFFLY